MADYTDYEADREAVQQWVQRGTFVVDGPAREWLLQFEDSQDHWLPVERGQRLYDFRGEPYVVIGGRAPRHAADSGKIFVHPVGAPGSVHEYYPILFNARWIYDFEE